MATGPSTQQTPYLIGLEPNVRFTSILSAGDQVGTHVVNGTTQPWVMVGIPDGLGAFDNGDGTITVLMNQELGNTSGVTREHGSKGAFVTELVIDKATLAVTHAEDLGKTILQDNDGDGTYTTATTAINRLCSADLAPVSAFFYAGADGIEGTSDDVGTKTRIFLDGEEAGPTGRAFAWIATGAEKGNVYELPGMGNMSFENVVASGNTGAKTVAMMQDDSTPGQVYLYVGDKQATGNEVQKAGLVGGKLYGIAASGIGNSATGTSENQLTPQTTPTTGSFALKEITGAATLDGAAIETASDTAGVTEWWRPEDGAWDTVNHNRYYFVTTSGQQTPSRLWSLDFTDINDPTAGGTFHMLLEGTEGQVMFDNITVDANGHVILCEDPGGFQPASKVWDYDPTTDTLNVVAKHDPARFGDRVGGVDTAPTAPFTTDEESSGVLDVSYLLGDADTQAYLIDTQAHYTFTTSGPAGVNTAANPTEVVEGGQLQVMFVDAAETSGTRGDDELRASYLDEEMLGRGGDDLMLAGSGADTLRGGAGDDTLVGGAGADEIRGGADADVIRYMAASEGGDIVFGFAHGEDGIEVSAAGFGGGLVAGVLDAARFVVGTTATAAFGQFLFDTADRTLWWDADGTGAGTAVLIADFVARPTVTADDITVIA